ncbi:Hemophore HasA [Pectobacterium sp. F1-1]|uniref:heme acquisition protein HasA n=1 Tax=Pectobacterium sp. F1-1 TaxID=2949614 RepID=UPI0021D7C967|nr:heme acquisition protein HasA [Pectobacterium sp. F1-1]UYA59750.1 Hemophore HasA [Pectobacterium sp. F1-1]
MSLSIQYDTEFSSYSISQYLTEWSSLFGDANHTNGNVTDSNSGGFYGGTSWNNGTQYSLVSPNNATSAFVAEGNLTYQFSNHVLYGQLDSLTFGDGLSGGTSTEYAIQEPQVTFSGLDLSSIVDSGREGVVHQVVYGLMSGQVQPLLDALTNAGIDINASLDSLSFATATSDAALSADTVVDVVGVAETTDLLAA